MSYFNTTQEPRHLEQEYEDKAKAQERRVYDWLRKQSRPVTSDDVHEQALPEAPITSARRALTNLANEGKVEKVGKCRGQYGRNVYRWQVTTGQLRLV